MTPAITHEKQDAGSLAKKKPHLQDTHAQDG